MPYKEKIIEKKYFTIGDVASQFNVATSLIRFWEGEFSVLKPKKNRKGNRQFTRDDIENLKLIYHLVKERGFTLNGAKEMLKNESQSVKNKIELIDSLNRVKSFLTQMRNELPES